MGTSDLQINALSDADDVKILIYDIDRVTVLKVIETFESFIWTERYQDVGDFELVVTPSEEMFDVLQMDNYVALLKLSETFMIIENIELEENSSPDEPDRLIVSGRSMLSVFDRRTGRNNAAWGSGGMSPGDAADTALAFIISCAFGNWKADSHVSYILNNWSDDTRITNHLISTSQEFRSSDGSKNQLDEVFKIMEMWGVGIREYVPGTGNVYFGVYFGRDRTSAQNDYAPVIFSPEFGNLEKSKTAWSTTSYRNWAIVWGAPEPAPVWKTLYRIYGETNTLLNRQVFVDGSNISPYLPGTSTPKSQTDYDNELIELGKLTLFRSQPTQFFSGTVINKTFLYGEDYFLGDIVEFRNSYGMVVYAQVKEVTYSFDDSGLVVQPLFDFDYYDFDY